MDQEVISKYLNKFNSFTYYNKKDVMYRLESPITIDEFWPTLLSFRKKNSTILSLTDQNNNQLWFVLTEFIKKRLEVIDNQATENFFDKVDEKIQKSVILNALIDEAFNSSVIEGAFSTKKKTRELVEQKTVPNNKSEQMIYNNYKALDFILENLNKPINEDLILSVYKIVVDKTLDNEDKYRDGMVYVWDLNSQQPIYTPPNHIEVQPLMNKLIEFINREDELHPIVKSCIIHFYFVYIHPFFDGNGRTARAISYMYLLKKGYNFFKFFSISTVVKEHKGKYYKALKDTEDYDSDLTYFIYFYVEMIVDSIVRIINQFEKEYLRKIIETYLLNLGINLSKRQKRAINHFIRVDKNFTDIEEYKKRSKITYETARTDLNQLVQLGIFSKLKEGKKYIFKMATASEILHQLEKLSVIKKLK